MMSKWMWRMYSTASTNDMKEAITELQDKWKPEVDDSVTYEWVTEQITTKFEELESRIDQLQAQLDTLVVTKRIVEDR